MSSIPEYSLLFNKCFSLNMLPREHLLLLHKSVLHSSFIAEYVLFNYSLENQLQMWQYRTLIDEKKLENIDQFSPPMLYRRGLYLHVNKMGKVLENKQINLLYQMDKKSSKSLEKISIDEQILNGWRSLLKQ